MVYDADTIPAEELATNTDYFERLAMLDQLAGLRPEQMLDDTVVGSYADHSEQVQYDLDRLTATDTEELPDQYQQQFAAIDQYEDQLAGLTDHPPHHSGETLTAEELKGEVAEYLNETETQHDDLDDATRLFYAKSIEHELRADHTISGVLDSTYVLSLLS
ncbi:MAG: hypothetical protein MUP66_02150 [Candidatus Nanohaloarchaeota archaeon QJJ-5]|nr:hypothetical protein [Candidatus Nanohaloarchaeota archaeon QJJ-5]